MIDKESNSINYDMPTPVSTVSTRVKKRQYFAQRSYKEETTMVSEWLTGSEFIDCCNSNLVVNVKLIQGGASSTQWVFGFGQGSGGVLNMFKNIRIIHKSGTVISDSRNINQWSRIKNLYEKSFKWTFTVGENMGIERELTFVKNWGPSEDITRMETSFCIPLKYLHPFFNESNGNLLPPQLSDYIRIEIDLAPINECIQLENVVDIPNPVSQYTFNYEITNIFWDLMTVNQTGSVQQAIRNKAESVMTYMFKDIYTTQSLLQPEAFGILCDIRKSVSKAHLVFTIFSDPAPDINSMEPPMSTVYNEGHKWWYRVGSMNYPVEKIDNKALAYKNALICFDRYDNSKDFNTLTETAFITSTGLYGHNLKLQPKLKLSEIPINGSCPLAFEVDFGVPLTHPYMMTTFLEYVVALQVSNNDVEVMI